MPARILEKPEAVDLRSVYLRLAGLEETALYRREDTGEVRSGAGWMRGGVLMEAQEGDYVSRVMHFVRV